ncbi:MAG TPA: polyprenyl synthetase family protein [bacterium]|nr:polyprenyl synthetase family protein [bacterium]HNC49838.1 polyprenyl synthetase family protein [bacterium]
MKHAPLKTDPIVKEIDKAIKVYLAKRNPTTLYDPARYLFQSGGKRMRAVMTALSCALFEKNYKKSFPAAAAVELLHNFSLVHDDIMDNDDLRRGRETIHKKWNANVAILTGDLLHALAFKSLNGSPESVLPRVLDIFSDAYIGLVEGQALDKEFEKRSDIKLPDYLKMIELKTAGLFAAAAQIGAVVGKADSKKEQALRDYGYYCGMAFQIQDDLLDVIGDEATLGKDICSDLMEGKKSYIALHCVQDKYGKDFLSVFQNVTDPDILKRVIEDFRKFIQKTGIQEKTEKAIAKYVQSAVQSLDRIKDSSAKAQLVAIAHRAGQRKN